uniref:Mitochondrial inner membrane protease subunit 2 n=1 Tax=Rhabditophanes sp. KR3021 TaxID=114890 RepID=A0AC35UD70_9BILA
MESSNAWMRDGLKSHVNTEDYLLGKTIDRNFELFSDVVIKEEVGTLESIKAKYRDGHSNFMSSVKEISKEDPMIAVKVSEVQRMEGILQNPVFKLKIEKYLRKEFDKYYNGQIAMTPTTVAGGLTSRREMITERRSRSPQFSKRTDHSVEEDWRKMPHSRSHQSSRIEMAKTIIKSGAIYGITMFYVFEKIGAPVIVHGDSMEPTLHGKRERTCDIVWINKMRQNYSKNEVVVCRNPREKEECVIKRISHVEKEFVPIPKPPYKLQIEPNQFFLHSDNAAVGIDSRVFGPVPKSLIIGKASAIIWPPGRWQRL